MNDYSNVFESGKITTVLSAPAGSTGKGTLAARLVDHSKVFIDIVVNTFSTQASHTVVEDDGTEHVYKHLNSCAHLPNKYGKMYIGHGAAISLPVLLKEIRQYGMTPEKLGIDPLCVIIQSVDKAYEKGECGFDGEDILSELIKSGTTASGVGAALARKILRRPNVKMAKDIRELHPFLCNVGVEIMDALDHGAVCLAEVAQGFQLGISAWNGDEPMFPFTTSRNSTPAQCLNDLNVAVKYQGDVILDFRTFPIRIHNNRYISTEDVKVDELTDERIFSNDYHRDHFDFIPSKSIGCLDVIRRKGSNLYWDEINDPKFEGKFEVFEANSGPNYPDSVEVDWCKLTEDCGSPTDLTQITTLTKLPRRVATFSRINMKDAIRHCQPPSGHKVWLSINFVNWVDYDLTGVKSFDKMLESQKLVDWMAEFIYDNTKNVLMYGTGPKHSEYVNPDCDGNSTCD